MRCPDCQSENAETNLFCIFCGARLPREPEEADEDRSGGEPAPRELLAHIRVLQAQIGQLRAALRAYGIPVDLPEPPKRTAPGAAGEWALGAKADASQAPEPGGAAAGAGMIGGVVRRAREVDWELVLGGNWLVRIGVLAVVIGAGFFLKLAFDNAWIGETGRVVLGLVVGVAMLGGGEYWRRRYPIYARALAGGGIALLYLSIFAAFALYGLIGTYPAVGMLLLISVGSAAFALRYESLTLALIGVAGAYIAPFILGGFSVAGRGSVAGGQSVPLLAYILTVGVSVLALSTFRNWRWFTLLGLVGSLATFGLWHSEFESTTSLLVMQGGLTLIFLTFVGATTLYQIVWRRAPQAFDLSLMMANAIAYFGISYGFLWDEIRPWMGGFTLLLALFYGGVAYLALLRSRENVYLSFMALGIALVFLTIAAPVQLAGSWVTVAWSVEAAVLMWLSFALRMPRLRWASVLVFAVLVVHLVAFDTVISARGYTVLLNERILAFGPAVAAFCLAAYLVWRGREALLDWESRYLAPSLIVAANALTLWVLSAEVIGAVRSGAVAVPERVEGNVISLSLSLLWAAYGSLALVFGIVRGWRPVRLGGLVLLAIPILKLFLVDSFGLERGYRVAAFLVLGTILLAGGYLYQRYSTTIRGFLFEDQQPSLET